MMGHDDGPLEQVETIRTDDQMDGDGEQKIASKVSVGKDSASVKIAKLTARLLASVLVFLLQLQYSPIL